MTARAPIPSTDSPHQPHQPRAIQAFLLVITASLTVMVAALIGPSLPLMEQHFRDVPNVAYWVPMTMTVPMLTMAFCSVFIGLLSDRIGRKRLLVVSTVLYGVLGTAPLYLPSLGAIVASRFALGLTEAALMVVSTAMIGDYYRGAQRDRFMSLQVTLGAVSGFVLNLIGGLFAEHGWRAPYAVYAVSGLLAPLMAVYLWEPPRAARGAGPAAPAADDPPFRPGLLAAICTLGVVTGLVYLVVPVNFGYLLNGLDVTSTTHIGAAYGLNSLGVIAGTLAFGGWIAGRLGIVLQLTLAAAIAAVGFLLMQAADAYATLAGAGVLNGFGCGLLLPAMVTWTMRSVPAARRGMGNGAFQSALYLGMSLSPLLVVALQARLGGRPAAVAAVGAALAGLALLGGLQALVQRERRPALQG